MQPVFGHAQIFTDDLKLLRDLVTNYKKESDAFYIYKDTELNYRHLNNISSIISVEKTKSLTLNNYNL